MKLKRSLTVGLASAALVVGAAAPAFAGGPYFVGGGIWYHTGGGEGDTIVSRYTHYTDCHSATAKNADGVSDKTYAAQNYEAYAAVPGTDDTDYAYWNNDLDADRYC